MFSSRTIRSLFSALGALALIAAPVLAQSISNQGPPVTPSQNYSVPGASNFFVIAATVAAFIVATLTAVRHMAAKRS